MSGHEFDELTRKLSGRASRRSVLKGLVGAAAAAVGGRFGRARAADDACSPPGGRCTAALPCCTDTPTTCINNRCCPNAQVCVDSAGNTSCCPTGQICVGNTCCPRERVCTDPNGVKRCCPAETTC